MQTNNVNSIADNLRLPGKSQQPAVIGNGSKVMKRFQSDELKNHEMVQVGSNAGTYGTLAYSPDKLVYAAPRAKQNDGQPVERLPVSYKESRAAVIQTTTGLNGQTILLNRNWG